MGNLVECDSLLNYFIASICNEYKFTICWNSPFRDDELSLPSHEESQFWSGRLFFQINGSYRMRGMPSYNNRRFNQFKPSSSTLTSATLRLS